MGRSDKEKRAPSQDEAPDTARTWWSISAEDSCAELSVSPSDGLDDDAADTLRQRFGPNRIEGQKGRSVLRRLLAQFNNLLIQILLVAVVLTAIFGEWLESSVILLVVLVNAVIGFVQEGRAEKALRAIQDMLSPTARVVRSGRRMSIPAEELVPGDIVVLDAGAKVPADLRILESNGLQTQEAMLTGESAPVAKSADAQDEDTVLADRRSMAYSGTLVSSGQGIGLVVETGARTEIGRISGMLDEVTDLKTPLLRSMDTFARWLSLIIIGVAGLVFALGVLVQGEAPAEMLMTAVAIAVAAIPEGLPAILTVTLAIGVQRMAARRAIIRKLPAVETLGALTIICSDKTGTLTRNELVLSHLALPRTAWEIRGTGYESEGEVRQLDTEAGGEGVDDTPAREELELALRAAVLCNDSSVHPAKDGEGDDEGRDDDDESAWTIDGDPLEAALLVAARRAKLDDDAIREAWPRRAALPFSSERKLMATLHEAPEDAREQGRYWLVVKGAPDRLLELAAADEGAKTPDAGRSWTDVLEARTEEGERVLGLAWRWLDDAPASLEDVLEGLSFAGLLGFLDPPRKEAIEAVAEAQTAGIRVIMITGDHLGTAKAVSRQVGLRSPEKAIDGRAIDALDDDGLAARVKEVDVYGRTTPEHKLRLVRALQAQGGVVGMTGDGVNDAPALKQADVGIAMGRKGTETAREASEMVLADDNFASIARAIREGRTVYDNLRKAITFLLPVNGGESASILIAIVSGLALPIAPLQILWVNMVSSVALAMALAFEPAEEDVMRRPPRSRDRGMLSGFLLWRIVFVSALFTVGIFGAWMWATRSGYDEATARTMAVNMLVVLEIFYLLSVRVLSRPLRGWRDLVGTLQVRIAIGLVLLLQALFTYVPFMQNIFGTSALGAGHLGRIAVAGLLFLGLLELEKWVRLRFFTGRRS